MVVWSVEILPAPSGGDGALCIRHDDIIGDECRRGKMEREGGSSFESWMHSAKTNECTGMPSCE